jgi:hypothetical protein
MTQRSRYTLVIEPTADCREPIVGLRRLLKCALRSFRFRCVSVSETVSPNSNRASPAANGASNESPEDAKGKEHGTNQEG